MAHFLGNRGNLGHCQFGQFGFAAGQQCGEVALLVPGMRQRLAAAKADIVRQAATVGLDPDRTRVAYEVGSWSAAMQTSLAEALGVADRARIETRVVNLT